MGAGESTMTKDITNEDKVNLSSLYRKPCKIDPALDRDPNRKAPPIAPSNCVVGSVAQGKDGNFYTLENNNDVVEWRPLSVSDEQMESIKVKLQKKSVEPLVDLPSLGGYNKKPCRIDPNLDKERGRTMPPIDPSNCQEGTIALGKNKVIYQISNGKWVKMLLGRAAKDSVLQQLKVPTRLGKPEDVPLLDMKREKCTIDPKLAADPKRRVPPIHPRECVEGTVAKGKDDVLYVLLNKRWVMAAKHISERKVELYKKELHEKVKAVTARTARARQNAVSPRKKPAAKKKSAKKKSAKKPAAPRS